MFLVFASICYLMQTKTAKIFWVGVVCLGFIGAGILIGKSYYSWQENPITTSITTHPIEDLDFPVVTICPRKGSNTGLYHDLVSAGNTTLSEEDRNLLKAAAYKIFMEASHKTYVKRMSPASQLGNMDQIVQGFHSQPEPFDPNGFVVRMWNLNGTITTPWFGKEYLEEYYEEDRNLLMVLELPDDIKDLVGSGSLIIELEVDTREETGWVEEVSLLSQSSYERAKNWRDAEAECQKEGGRLPVVTSEQENLAVKSVADGKDSWLGGRKELGQWTWSNQVAWGYTSWAHDGGPPEFPDKVKEGECVNSHGVAWYNDPCTKEHTFICQRVLKGKRKVKVVYNEDKLNFPVLYVSYEYKAASQQLLDSWKDKRMTGLRLSWRVESPTVTWTTSISEVG